jgi:hypothetical protein
MERQHRIGEQNEAYRKGLVLGLTMAEVGILIIFVLLLLLVFVDLERAKAARAGLVLSDIAEGLRISHDPASGGSVSQAGAVRDSIAALQKRDSALREIALAMNVPPETRSEDFTKLVRMLQATASAASGKSLLVEASAELEKLRLSQDELARIVNAGKGKGSEEIVRRLQVLVDEKANHEGQVAALQRKLAAAGQGTGERSCWAQPNGHPDFIFDVVLSSNGIRMGEHLNSHRVDQRARLPVQTADPGELLSEAAFLARTAALFQYSREASCRFFVVVYDATAPHEKIRYKNLLRTVENHFYKRLDNGSAPF